MKQIQQRKRAERFKEFTGSNRKKFKYSDWVNVQRIDTRESHERTSMRYVQDKQKWKATTMVIIQRELRLSLETDPWDLNMGIYSATIGG